MMRPWKWNEEPYSRKKEEISVSAVAKIRKLRLDLAMHRLLVTLMSSFGGVGSREN